MFPGQLQAQLQARFGRKQGWIRHHLAVARDRFGLYSAERQVDFSAVRRLVFVCQGNICRSAYAEARARKLGLPAASFGLDAGEGACANETAAARSVLRGVDLSAHRARRALTKAPGDLLLAMERPHLDALRARGFTDVTLLGLWATPARPHLEDPYGLSREYFDTCFDVIDSALHRIATLLGKAR